ncbi:MAG: hypothetical protein R3B68_12495 [Phycisphaerales bacterium]
MKSRLLCVAAIAAAAGVASGHTTYLDPFGMSSDVDPFFLNQGFNHLDIAAVEVENESGAFNFDIVVNADIASGTGTDWGKFLIFLDTAPGGRTDNPWGRSITSGAEADFYIGGWADGGGGAEIYQVVGGAWTLIGATYTTFPGAGVDLSNAAGGLWNVQVDEAVFGVTPGQIIGLDVVITAGGGGDPGVDHLSLGTVATPDWGTPSVGGAFLDYEVEPAPGSVAVLGIAGLLAGRRRRA